MFSHTLPLYHSLLAPAFLRYLKSNKTSKYLSTHREWPGSHSVDTWRARELGACATWVPASSIPPVQS